MSEKAKLKVLHMGELSFFMPWEKWYSKVGEIYGCPITIDIYNQNELSDFSEGEKIGRMRHVESQNKKNLFDNYDLIRFDRDWAVEAFHLVTAAPPLITTLQTVDLLYKKRGVLWPHLNFKEAIHSTILQSHPYLNTKGAGLIVGDSVEAIQVAYVLVELGLKHITFVVESEAVGSPFLELMKNSLFQIHFEVITKEKIILLPGIYSVMVCCKDLRDNAALLTSILYFNYLERGGLILNCVYPLDTVPLTEEALAIGAQCVSLPMIQIHEAVMAVQKLGITSIERLFQIEP